jgi:two-component system chemotaxis sensor kinase CheA
VSSRDQEIYELVRQEGSDCLQRMESNLLALESGKAGPEQIDAILRDAHSLKGSAAMVGWRELTRLASAIEDRMEQAREHGALPTEFTDPLLRAVDALARGLQDESAIDPQLHEELAALEPRVDDEPASSPPEDAGPSTEDEVPSAEHERTSTEEERAPAERAPIEGSANGRAPAIRIPAAKVDRMLDVVGETVLYHRRLEHELGATLDDGRHSSDILDMGERLLDDLQDSVVEMRTLPLSTITARFPRAIRDLATQEGKEAELAISGADTQLDRVILEGISETIVHVLRNAVAHGIEPPEQREAAGKPRTGLITLHADQRGGMVAITVADDGRGVSPDLLARVEEGRSLADILAETGFSTAEVVSDAAGRGVGLDAVKLHVESLSGALEVRSNTGAGTEVTLLLPVTLALMQALLFEWDEQPFAVPMSSVARVLAVTETTSLGGRRSLDLEGEAVPLTDLGTLIGAVAHEMGERPPALVLTSPGRRLAVACDELRGEEEIVIKSLGPLLGGVAGYLGAAILGDGRIALVLDPTHLLKAPLQAVARERAPSAPGRQPRKVLVVDDQFSARELQRGILETAGYSVQVAQNGRDALRKIAETADLDLVMTDVQMPEMDGFELLEAIRADRGHGSLPVVVVTTLGDEQSRKRGAEAGADAYVVKQDYDQDALLETIDHLVGM